MPKMTEPIESATSTTRVDLSDTLKALCQRLGIADYTCVREMTITPTHANVTIYRRNEDGAKYVDPETDTPATRTETFAVTT